MPRKTKGRIYKRGRIYWLEYHVNGVRIRESLRTTRRPEAEKERERRIAPYTTADKVAKAYARQQTESAYWGAGGNDWFQWDVIWKGFIDTAGANMDFYSVHFYDWPRWKPGGGQTIRAGVARGAVHLVDQG